MRSKPERLFWLITLTMTLTFNFCKAERETSSQKPCLTIYRRDLMFLWIIPSDSFICQDKLQSTDQRALTVLIDKEHNQMSIVTKDYTEKVEYFWITEEEGDFGVYVDNKDGFRELVQFKIAETPQLIGLVTYQQNLKDQTRKTIIYISKTDMLKEGELFSLVIPFTILAAPGILYILSYFYPVRIFAGVFCSIFFLLFAGMQATLKVHFGWSYLLSLIVIASLSAVPSYFTQKYSLFIVGSSVQAVFVLICLAGCGFNYIFIFLGGIIVLPLSAYCSEPVPVLKESLGELSPDCSPIKRNKNNRVAKKLSQEARIYLIFLTLSMFYYIQLAWTSTPGCLFLRLFYFRFFYSSMTEQTVWLDKSVGVLLLLFFAVFLHKYIKRLGSVPNSEPYFCGEISIPNRRRQDSTFKDFDQYKSFGQEKDIEGPSKHKGSFTSTEGPYRMSIKV